MPLSRKFNDEDLAPLNRALALIKSTGKDLRHPAAVAAKMDEIEEVAVASLLHVPFEQVREEDFPRAVMEALRVLQRREGERYPQYIERVKENSIARQVLASDLADELEKIGKLVIATPGVQHLKQWREGLRELTRVEEGS